MLIVKFKIAGATGKVLFDNKNEINFISHFICTQYNIAFLCSGYSPVMANGMELAFSELTSLVDVQVDSYTRRTYFTVSHLKRYDAVTETQWLASYRAAIFQ